MVGGSRVSQLVQEHDPTLITMVRPTRVLSSLIHCVVAFIGDINKYCDDVDPLLE